MSAVNRCAPDAWVVGADRQLPTDPTEFDWPDRQPPVGCCHMTCLWCKAEVKSKTGFYLKVDMTDRALFTKRAALLHSTDDWAAIDGVTPHAECRLYACSCFYLSEFTVSHTWDPESFDDNGQPSRNLPWTCAGHPPLELPFQLGGRSITDAAKLASVVADAAKDASKADIVRGLYYRTNHGSLQAVVADALVQSAAGPAPLDAALRSLFVAQTNLAPLSAFVEELIRYQRGLAQADPKRREQLVDILTAAIWQRPGRVRETGTIEVLRDEALAGVITPEQLRMFEVHDTEWFAAHAEDLVTKCPAHAGGILVRAGRAMLDTSGQEAAMKSVAAIARNTRMSADALLKQAESDVGMGVLMLDSKPIVEAIKNMNNA